MQYLIHREKLLHLLFSMIWTKRDLLTMTALNDCYYAPSSAEQSEAGWGAFYFSPYSDLYQVTTWELFKVTMYTAHIS